MRGAPRLGGGSARPAAGGCRERRAAIGGRYSSRSPAAAAPARVHPGGRAPRGRRSRGPRQRSALALRGGGPSRGVVAIALRLAPRPPALRRAAAASRASSLASARPRGALLAARAISLRLRLGGGHPVAQPARAPPPAASPSPARCAPARAARARLASGSRGAGELSSSLSRWTSASAAASSPRARPCAGARRAALARCGRGSAPPRSGSSGSGSCTARSGLTVSSASSSARPRARPGEGRDPLLALLGGPRLVLEHREHPASLARHLHVERRPQEAMAAQPEPAPDHLELVVGRPLEAIDLEGRRRARRRRARCGPGSITGSSSARRPRAAPPGDVAGPLGAEERRRRGDLLGGAEPARRVSARAPPPAPSRSSRAGG